uniref:Uncharacterized protein n=1 Tax=Anguilla anguilla TaxID=7936 RepID=A0A0E9R2Z2_ANGAN
MASRFCYTTTNLHIIASAAYIHSITYEKSQI